MLWLSYASSQLLPDTSVLQGNESDEEQIEPYEQIWVDQCKNQRVCVWDCMIYFSFQRSSKSSTLFFTMSQPTNHFLLQHLSKYYIWLYKCFIVFGCGNVFLWLVTCSPEKSFPFIDNHKSIWKSSSRCVWRMLLSISTGILSPQKSPHINQQQQKKLMVCENKIKISNHYLARRKQKKLGTKHLTQHC